MQSRLFIFVGRGGHVLCGSSIARSVKTRQRQDEGRNQHEDVHGDCHAATFHQQSPACKMLQFGAGKIGQSGRRSHHAGSFGVWQSSCNKGTGHASHWKQDIKRTRMNSRQSKYRHIVVLEGRRERRWSDIPDATQPTAIPETTAPCPASDPLPKTTNDLLPLALRRRERGRVVTHVSIQLAQRLIPRKSTNFRLRCRNLSYKRKWNLVWC